MKKKYLYSILSALFLALTALIFFAPDDLEGNTLQQHDIMQGLANGQEGKAYAEATGESTRWTNSLFSGMPNFQIAPSYPAGKALSWIGKAYSLWLPEPANLLWIMMAGFFIMCLCLKFRWSTSLFAALAWGFSSYFIIIIGAGHIWKFVTLAYIPPTIGGIVLCYRGRYLPGMALAALFGALQLQSNHPQMSYYFMLVVAAMVLAWLWTAVRTRKMKEWGIATAATLIAGVLAVGANSASLYSSYEYSKETVRGRATDLPRPDGSAAAGMDHDAITQWSYGIGETFSLLVPNVKGGATIKPEAGQTRLLSVAETDKASELQLSPEEMQFVGQFPQYFGDQPMTNGPVYVGAFVLLLALLALLVVDTPMKWALFAVSVLAVLLSWGHNFDALTSFFIDNFPGYNKFRAVSSILVVVEFTIPLLAAMCIRKMLDTPDFMKRYGWAAYLVGGLGAAVCFIGWVSPSVFGDAYSANEMEYLGQAGAFADPAYRNVLGAIREARLSLVSADCLRSLVFILLAALVIFMYFRGPLKSKNTFVCCLAALALLDLFTVGKRYVNADNFTQPADTETMFAKTPLDEQILRDTAMNYRVMDVQDMGGARSSYFHKTVGGYHAAKLTRYNDLLTRQISQGNMRVLNMLNTKYFLLADSVALNTGANGNAWLPERILYVDGAADEMSALDTLDTRRGAVADKRFREMLGQPSPKTPGDTIFETTYAPNRLTYHARNARETVAVFSEIYFPWGWTATVDGREVPIGRVDYTLRAIRLPAGAHTVEFAFDPESLKVTNGISVASVSLIYVICAGAAALFFVRYARRRKEEKGSK